MMFVNDLFYMLFVTGIDKLDWKVNDTNMSPVYYNFWFVFVYWFLNVVRFDFVKSPKVTLCGWRGYKPSINT